MSKRKSGSRPPSGGQRAVSNAASRSTYWHRGLSALGFAALGVLGTKGLDYAVGRRTAAEDRRASQRVEVAHAMAPVLEQCATALRSLAEANQTVTAVRAQKMYVQEWRRDSAATQASENRYLSGPSDKVFVCNDSLMAVMPRLATQVALLMSRDAIIDYTSAGKTVLEIASNQNGHMRRGSPGVGPGPPLPDPKRIRLAAEMVQFLEATLYREALK